MCDAALTQNSWTGCSFLNMTLLSPPTRDELTTYLSSCKTPELLVRRRFRQCILKTIAATQTMNVK